MEVRHFCKDIIEPKAADLFELPIGKYMTVAEISALSQAISLKRIADALEPVVVSGSFSTESLTGLIQHLAWEGGRSFQHGLRTDR